ncbi:aminopeptidase P family protein [Mycoplasmoides pneumoniae]|uniref:Putative Xaa-Pro aminopeptidase n=1 Tax=Mycoplasma pneumoniae (strain ATCC 29342 / M129 / Subtype 1) TaxID=272634 RepID=AMPP_MYCPN|nr:Xaa-Pro peptidase family protein [Mycoplasmoides pneumoniae]P75313.1 RecName: Full=Putative Xaa-Pro aminopeptidase; Short=X-Pro aminopeptidase; AltName: Full=Aminoacylproline aminopeptidase; AltName: Full=Aminopeptidase P; Short=APP [Mycoplasmoides pneumoniae M129]AAB96019.1 X-Pro dipeptidase [Mycoplasmoides pneumoniae M129]AGC04363.1 Xaa-Pro aminopeptidase [Mycoplasmoides pneumoniae M129-B7]ALA30343.1 Xaa-Pro aminopeptidase [Mycoplasmoides pneumoniae PI 1428]ALA32448.1 Xaa-Pro aminopeptida
MHNELQQKLAVLHKLLQDNKADAILIGSDQNRFWLTGFPSSAGWLVVHKQRVNLFIDGRYFEAAKTAIDPLVKVELFTTYKQVKALCEQVGVKHLLIEGDYLTFNYQNFIKELCAQYTVINAQEIRRQKLPSEILAIEKVVEITRKVAVKLKRFIQPGMTELFIAQWITDQLVKAGGAKNSFDPIVATGKNGANPHHKPSKLKVKSGDFVTCDFGTIYNGYCSDITRTFLVGKKPNNEVLLKAYKKVDEANMAGINAANTQLTGAEVDKVCRDIIEASEFKDYFVHSTGHGVGLDIHEMPNVSTSYNKLLCENAVITIEPGIYIPSVGGIRIEDMVLVKDHKSVWLSAKIPRAF